MANFKVLFTMGMTRSLHSVLIQHCYKKSWLYRMLMKSRNMHLDSQLASISVKVVKTQILLVQQGILLVISMYKMMNVSMVQSLNEVVRASTVQVIIFLSLVAKYCS